MNYVIINFKKTKNSALLQTWHWGGNSQRCCALFFTMPRPFCTLIETTGNATLRRHIENSNSEPSFRLLASIPQTESTFLIIWFFFVPHDIIIVLPLSRVVSGMPLIGQGYSSISTFPPIVWGRRGFESFAKTYDFISTFCLAYVETKTEQGRILSKLYRCGQPLYDLA